MATISSNYINYTIDKPKKRRAELVCLTCHSKKIKCDLQIKRKEGIDICSYCKTSNKGCEVRPSKRENRRPKNRAVLPTRSEDAASSSTTAGNSAAAHAISIGSSHSAAASGGADGQNTSEHGSSPATTAPRQGYRYVTQQHDDRRLGHLHVEELSHKQRRTESFASPPRASPTSSAAVADLIDSHKGDLDSGFLRVYRKETRDDVQHQAQEDGARRPSDSINKHIQPGLLQVFTQTYFDNCYAWCPVLDADHVADELAASPLLSNALALVGSHVQPPMLPHDGPATYYDRARRMFYDDEEADPLISLKSLLLFYWWAPRSSAMVHRHGSWWWTSTVIRHAQFMGFHWEPTVPQTLPESRHYGLRRRIWWTAFARERMSALCQSKPVMISLNDCNIPWPTRADFPPDLPDPAKADVFIHWVHLCAILGRLAQHLARNNTARSPYPKDIAAEMIDWVRSLPPHLHLPIGPSHTSAFSKDVHQLYLPYLTAIVVLHLKRPTNDCSLPKVLPPAVVAASCVARILRDILARGDTRFLMAITSWYCGMSYIALLAASRDPTLSSAVAPELEIVELACNQLSTMWASAGVIFSGFARLREAAQNDDSPSDETNIMLGEQSLSRIRDMATGSVMHDGEVDWKEYFPFATSETSPLANLLLCSDNGPFDTFANSNLWMDTSILDFQDWFTFDGMNSNQFMT